MFATFQRFSSSESSSSCGESSYSSDANAEPEYDFHDPVPESEGISLSDSSPIFSSVVTPSPAEDLSVPPTETCHVDFANHQQEEFDSATEADSEIDEGGVEPDHTFSRSKHSNRRASAASHLSVKSINVRRFSTLGSPVRYNFGEFSEKIEPAVSSPPGPDSGIQTAALFGVDVIPDFSSKNQNIGDEPGINTHTTIVDIPSAVGSQVMIIDYSRDRLRMSRLDVDVGNCRNALDLEDRINSRPPWSAVRWIVVNGLSWEAIGPLASFYDLHPLALEDMLEVPQRTKVEVFSSQMFCCFPLHLLTRSKVPLHLWHRMARASLRRVVRSTIYIIDKVRQWKTPTEKSEKGRRPHGRTATTTYEEKKWFRRRGVPITDAESQEYNTQRRKLAGYSSSGSSSEGIKFSISDSFVGNSSASYQSSTTLNGDSTYHWGDDEEYGECFVQVNPEVSRKLKELPIRSMYQWNRGNDCLQAEAAENLRLSGQLQSTQVSIEQVSMFLMKDTVITFFEKSAPAVYLPIVRRLESPSTMLRETEDPAVLVHAILDASVDIIAPISVEYRSRLSSLQVAGAQRPTLKHTRQLSGVLKDLELLLSTVSSLANLAAGLRSKSVRVCENFKSLRSRTHRDSVMLARDEDNYESARRRHSRRPSHLAVGSDTRYFSDKQKSFSRAISDVAAVYFGDVTDHALQYAQDFKTMRNHAKTLIVSLQNEISIRGGDAVAMLSLVTVVFLPLSFLTGYFGMNFTNFDTLNNDVSYYWTFAGPAGAGLALVLMYPAILAYIRQIWHWITVQVESS